MEGQGGPGALQARDYVWGACGFSTTCLMAGEWLRGCPCPPRPSCEQEHWTESQEQSWLPPAVTVRFAEHGPSTQHRDSFGVNITAVILQTEPWSLGREVTA